MVTYLDLRPCDLGSIPGVEYKNLEFMRLRIPPLNDNRRSTYRGGGQNKQIIVKTMVGLVVKVGGGQKLKKKEKKKRRETSCDSRKKTNDSN